MFVVIMGCGRTGARIATSLATEGDRVVVIERDRRQLGRLPSSLIDEGLVTVVEGDGTTSQALTRAEIEEADIFVAVSGQDTVNGLAAQKARGLFGVNKVVVRVRDPSLAGLYEAFGLDVLSTTEVAVERIMDSISSAR